MIQLETIEVFGDSTALGRSQGEAFRARIAAFIDMRFGYADRYFAERRRPGRDRLVDVGRAGLEHLRRWDPEGYAEHCGVAEGARVDAAQLFTAANLTDVRDAVLLSDPDGEPMSPGDPEGCTAVLVPATRTTKRTPLAAQTWDLNPGDLDYVVAIQRVPKEGPRTWSVTCTGCPTLVGINDRGLAVGTTNIKTYGSRPGVGYLGILHRAIRAPGAKEASALIAEAPWSAAHTIWFADSEEQTLWEGSPAGIHSFAATEHAVCFTNHCQTAAHREREGERPTESSTLRLQHARSTLQNGSVDVAALRRLFSDRTHGVHSINRYPEDNQGTATNAVFIAEPADRRAWACRGPADRGSWIELTF